MAALLPGLPFNVLAATGPGPWNNTAFASLGDARIDIIAGAAEASVTVDLQRTVSGFANPAPIIAAGWFRVYSVAWA